MQVLENQVHQLFAGYWSHQVYKMAKLKYLQFTIDRNLH